MHEFNGESFLFAQTYNTLGDLSALTYPCRSTTTNSQVVCTTAAPTPPLLNAASTTAFPTSPPPSPSTFGPCGLDACGNQFCEGEPFPPVALLGTTNHYVAYTYDAAGNVLSDGKRTFAYDPLSMMTRAQVSGRDFRYLYSADDERIAAVERVTGSGDVVRNRTTWTLRGFDNQLLSDWTDDWTSGSQVTTWREDEIRRRSQLLANLSAASNTRHYILDHLGSPPQVAHSRGQLLASHDFTPFRAGGT